MVVAVDGVQVVTVITGIVLVIDVTDPEAAFDANAAVKVDVEVDAFIPLQKLRITCVEAVEGISICVCPNI